MRSALILLAACWTGEVAAPAPPPPPRVHHHRPPPEEQVTLARLEEQLRSDAGNVLPAMIDRGVVELDLDTGSVTMLCDAQAFAQIPAWVARLDPVPPPIVCVATPQGGRCMHVGIHGVVIFDLRHDSEWTLTGVIFGVPSAHGSRAAYEHALAATPCP